MHELDTRKVPKQYAVGLERTFRRSGGARRVDHHGGIVGRSRFRLEARGGPLQGCVEIERAVAGAVDREHQREVCKRFTQARELRKSASIGDQGLGTRVRQPVGERIRPEQGRERQRDRAKLVDRDMDRGDLRHLRQHQRDPVSAHDAVRPQRIGEPVRRLAQCAVVDFVEAPVSMLVQDRDPARLALRPTIARSALSCGRSRRSLPEPP